MKQDRQNHIENKLLEIQNDHFVNNSFDNKTHSPEIQLKKLYYISKNFDPFNQDHLDGNIVSLINDFRLFEFTNNPFAFTNELLKLIDQYETLLKNQIQ